MKEQYNVNKKIEVKEQNAENIYNVNGPMIFNNYDTSEKNSGLRKCKTQDNIEYCLPMSNSSYIRRTDDLIDLEKKLKAENIVFISGFTGIGKTQLAKGYLYEHKKEYKQVYWFKATNEQELDNEYLQLLRSYNELGDIKENESDLIRKKVKQFIEHRGSCLMVIDNANDITPYNIKEYLPLKNTKIIITTQNGNYEASNFKGIKLIDMQLSEAKQFFLSFKNDKWYNNTDVEELVNRLHRYPLALEYARGYICTTKCSIQDYIKIYKENPNKILNSGKEYSDEYGRTISTAWNVSFEKLINENIDSKLIYKFMAQSSLLVNFHIPKDELFIKTNEYTLEEMNDIISVLNSYSFINVEENGLSIHDITQKMIKEKVISSDEYLKYINQDIVMITKAFPKRINDDEDRRVVEIILPHAINVINCGIESKNIDIESLSKFGLDVVKRLYGFSKYNDVKVVTKDLINKCLENHHKGYTYGELKHIQAQAYHYTGNPNRALNICDEVLNEIGKSVIKLSQQEKNKMMSKIYGIKGIIYKDIGKHGEEGIGFYNKALSYAYKSEDKLLIGNQLLNNGNIYKRKEYGCDYDKAFACYFESLNLGIENKALESRVLGAIGLICKEAREVDKKYEFYEKALSYAYEQEKITTTNNKSLISKEKILKSRVLDDIREICKQSKKDDKKYKLLLCCYYQEKCLEICESIGEGKDISNCLNNLGDTYMELGKEEEAYNSLVKALEKAKETNFASGQVRTLANLGLWFNKFKDNSQKLARDYFKQALIIAEAINYTEVIPSIKEWLK